MIISFGLCQSYYVTSLSQLRSTIAWIGSNAIFLLFSTGMVSGRLTDAGYFQYTTLAGASLVVLGTFMTSLVDSYWQILLAQSVCTGLGNGLLLTPMMTLLTTCFSKKLSIVMRIAACGSFAGVLIFPSMAKTLLPSFGFAWTLRAMGSIQLATLAVALVCSQLETRTKGGASGPLGGIQRGSV
jgi:MFS family permease